MATYLISTSQHNLPLFVLVILEITIKPMLVLKKILLALAEEVEVMRISVNMLLVVIISGLLSLNNLLVVVLTTALTIRVVIGQKQGFGMVAAILFQVVNASLLKSLT